MMIWPLSGTSVPASTCISVDLPAPLWPTSPTHSPTLTGKSTPASARTAPKCFSTPSNLTMSTGSPDMTPINQSHRSARMPRTSLFLCAIQISFDCLLGLILRVFVASHTASRDVRKCGLEVILGERKIRHEQVMRDVLAAVQDLLGDPEGKCRHAGRNRCGPRCVTVLSLLLFP